LSGRSTSSESRASIQERSRELAVLESLDNGKPIRESRRTSTSRWRQLTFFYYAGWADKLEHAGFGPNPAPLESPVRSFLWNFR